MSFGPRISVKVLNSAGPTGEGLLDIIGSGKASSVNKVWQLNAKGQLSTELGAEVDFDKLIADYKESWVPYEWDIYTTPYELKLVSGDGQDFVEGQELTEPIVVRVLDSDKGPQSNVYVKVELGANDGQLTSSAEVKTDANGKAQFRWKPKDRDSKLVIVIKDPEGKHLTGSPVEVGVDEDIAQMLIDYGPWKSEEFLFQDITDAYSILTISRYDYNCWKDEVFEVEGGLFLSRNIARIEKASSANKFNVFFDQGTDKYEIEVTLINEGELTLKSDEGDILNFTSL